MRTWWAFTATIDCRSKGTGKTLVSPRTATAGPASARLRRGELVMANLKAARTDRFVQLLFGLLVNQGVQFPLDDAIEECMHLFFFPRNVKFHSAIRQVTHPPSHVETLGGMAHRPPEPDALDISLVEDLKRNHTRWLLRSCCLLDGRPLPTHRESSIASSLHLYE